MSLDTNPPGVQSPAAMNGGLAKSTRAGRLHAAEMMGRMAESMFDDEEGALPLPECPDDKPERWRGADALKSTTTVRMDRRDPFVDALEQAAVRLRDAELELRASREHYGKALNAFNQFVAPVPG